MATISDALRYMADREVQITQRQRQGMQYALSLAQFQAEKSFREKQFQQQVFQTTLSRQYEINEEALGQEIGSFTQRLVSSTDVMTSRSYADDKEGNDLKRYQKALMKNGFSTEDSNTVMAVLSGYHSESPEMAKHAQRVAANLALKIGSEYSQAKKLQSADYWESTTGKAWVSAGLIGGDTEEERSLNEMSLNNISGAMQNKSSINNEFLQMIEGDYELDDTLYDMATPEMEEEFLGTATTDPQAPVQTVVTLNEWKSKTNRKIEELERERNNLEVRLGVGGDVDEQILANEAEMKTAQDDLAGIDVLMAPAEKEQKLQHLIDIARGESDFIPGRGRRHYLKKAFKSGEISQQTYDDLLYIANEGRRRDLEKAGLEPY